MTDDHTFIDIPGEITKGKDVMKGGWRNSFTDYPDYRNIFTRFQVKDDFVVMLGYSTCSYEPLDGPSLWSAEVREGRVSVIAKNLVFLLVASIFPKTLRVISE